MESHDEPIPNKKKGEKQPIKRKDEYAKADPSEDGCTYGIDRLNIGEAANDLESNSE